MILLDINLPDLDGFQVLKALSLLPETRHIPVIALTAAATETDVKRGQTAGFFSYLTKPTAARELIATIRRALHPAKPDTADKPLLMPRGTTLDEAKAYSIGGYRSAQTDYLIELGFPNVEIAPHERMNVERLLKGRVDMVPSLELMMAERLKSLDSSYDTVEKVIVFDARFDYYLATNENVSDDVVSRLQDALDQAKADGTYDSIRAKYIN